MKHRFPIHTMNLCVDKKLFSGVYVVNWRFIVSLRLFSEVYEGKYIFDIFNSIKKMMVIFILSII